MRKQLAQMVGVIVCGLALSPVHAQDTPITYKEGQLLYETDAKGNRILDFSYCGYRNSDVAIPDLPVRVYVSPVEGDNSAAIQRAIDYVSSLKADTNGLRGVVLLRKGTYRLDKPLYIRTSGVALRGADKTGVVLEKHGYERGAIVYIEGYDNRKVIDTLSVASDYVPVNARTLSLASKGNLKVGDRVLVYRPSEKEWIASVGCDIFGGGISSLGWKPGDADLYWDRTVERVEGNSITLDAPLTMALDASNAHCKVLPYTWSGRIADSGVENLSLVADYDKQYPLDENHAWTGVSINHAENCWVRNLNFSQLAGSAVVVQPTVARVTVEDCIATHPVSEIAGLRRQIFYTLGQLTLFQRCYSEQGIHDFVAGMNAPGPNAFVQCQSSESKGYSGAVGAWACGLLFDVVNIDGHDLAFRNLGQSKAGAGWNTGNSVFWQCTAAEIHCYSPATDAKNHAYGCWAQFSGDGVWSGSNNHISPRSLFDAQLTARLQSDVSKRNRVWTLSSNGATSSPNIDQAMLMSKEAMKPLLTLRMWIDQRPFDATVSTEGVKSIDEVKFKQPAVTATARKLCRVENGVLVADGCLMTGNVRKATWWSGSLRPNYVRSASDNITRFVPDREGTGFTDRIDSVVRNMKQRHNVAMFYNYGLWYDRRRDDHERIRRRDADVWAPFYEQPFARSGQGSAWEGLSKYDLTRPNTWYWGRLKEFADKAEPEGILLYYNNYFQHNILEAGAHWVDCPWRTANNINDTGFPEPVNFAGDKRIFVAEMFYDINHPVRRELHRNYIRQCLDNFVDNSNVIQFISAEYTGPLHFMQFWLDCIAEWEQETGKHALVALSATKDVQDAILSDPKRAAVVDIIDIRYWHYRVDGSAYAPEGGKNMAPRQHARKVKEGKMGAEGAYKAVSEYRTKYPDKAVMLYAQNYPDQGWPVLMAGGSCPVLRLSDETLLRAIPRMRPVVNNDASYQLLQGDNGALVRVGKGREVALRLPAGTYRVKYVHERSGEVSLLAKKVKVTGDYTLKAEKGGVYWLEKIN